MTSSEDPAALLEDPARFLDHEDPALRRLAVAAFAARPQEVLPVLATLLGADPDPGVRAEAAEVLAGAGPEAIPVLAAARTDPDPRVVEAVATASGEVPDPGAVSWLLELASGHEDRLVREAAVASLGAIGDERALPTLLRLLADGPPQVRRRAVVALTAFDGPDVEAALRAAVRDRNPMVREAAEMVIGRDR